MRDFGKETKKAAVACLAVAAALVVTTSTAFAQRVPSEGEILNALKPRVTRALSTADPQRNAAEQRAISDIRAVRTRSLTSQEREQVAAIARTKPSIDLEIYFDYNSATISPRAVASLATLGRALTDPQLRGSVFLVGGHTDARGGEEFNLGLSERRAQAVKDYLVQKFRIADDTLVVAGFGEEQLKNKAVPYAAQNRRVQVSNLQSQQEANR
jgi:outer membrane protein OmpA-like peptidoglycan-associated protein